MTVIKYRIQILITLMKSLWTTVYYQIGESWYLQLWKSVLTFSFDSNRLRRVWKVPVVDSPWFLAEAIQVVKRTHCSNTELDVEFVAATYFKTSWSIQMLETWGTFSWNFSSIVLISCSGTSIGGRKDKTKIVTFWEKGLPKPQYSNLRLLLANMTQTPGWELEAIE